MASDWAGDRAESLMTAMEQVTRSEAVAMIADELRRERRARQLFVKEEFTMHSGGKGTVKIECDALTPESWDGLAELAKVTGTLPPFGEVVGVPRGGLPFAEALRPYATKGPRLVVDDVWTTGRSMREGMGFHDVGLVAFARGPVTNLRCNAIFAPLTQVSVRPPVPA